MTTNNTNLRELKSIMEWVKLNDGLREVSLKYGDVELFMSRNTSTASTVAAPATPAAAPVAAAAPAPVAAPAAQEQAAPAAPAPAPAVAAGDVELAANEVLIKAPMVGTFYSSPSPGEPPFVAVGDKVQNDSILCIIEMMKLMNNIEAKTSGTVTRILVNNEEAVEYGQPLFVIQTDS